MSLLATVWFVIAVLMFVGEIFTTGFVLACFGVAALLAGITAVFGGTLPLQLGVFALVTAVSIPLARRFAEKITGPQPEGVGVDRVVGKTAVVIEEIDNRAGKGRVRVGSEEWRAESADGSVLVKGSTVLVEKVVGAHVVVRPQNNNEGR